MKSAGMTDMNDNEICFHTTTDADAAERKAMNLRNSGYFTHIKQKKYKFYGETVIRYEVYGSLGKFNFYKSNPARKAKKENGYSVFEVDKE